MRRCRDGLCGRCGMCTTLPTGEFRSIRFAPPFFTSWDFPLSHTEKVRRLHVVFGVEIEICERAEAALRKENERLQQLLRTGMRRLSTPARKARDAKSDDISGRCEPRPIPTLEAEREEVATKATSTACFICSECGRKQHAISQRIVERADDPLKRNDKDRGPSLCKTAENESRSPSSTGCLDIDVLRQAVRENGRTDDRNSFYSIRAWVKNQVKAGNLVSAWWSLSPELQRSIISFIATFEEKRPIFRAQARELSRNLAAALVARAVSARRIEEKRILAVGDTRSTIYCNISTPRDAPGHMPKEHDNHVSDEETAYDSGSRLSQISETRAPKAISASLACAPKRPKVCTRRHSLARAPRRSLGRAARPKGAREFRRRLFEPILREEKEAPAEQSLFEPVLVGQSEESDTENYSFVRISRQVDVDFCLPPSGRTGVDDDPTAFPTVCLQCMLPLSNLAPRSCKCGLECCDESSVERRGHKAPRLKQYSKECIVM